MRKHIHPFLALAVTALLLTSFARAAGPTGLLNDTGQTQCDDGSSVLAACTTANAGNTAPMPGQDGRFGRDVASPAKVGGGAAGFDYTKVCMDGTLNCTGAANTGATPAASDWACTKDNVTNLVWSLQIQIATWNAATVSTYPDAGHNSASRCGFSTGWRLPTQRELLSIVHRGPTAGPLVDVNYFPATGNGPYWTSDSYARNSLAAWYVDFVFGYTNVTAKTDLGYVRLVRAGQ
jgi:hypothetical protein